MTVSRCSFLKRCLPNIQVWITIVCQLYLQVRMVFCRKKQLVQPTIQTVSQVLYLNVQQKALFVFPIWVHRILRRCKMGWGLIKYNMFIKFNELIIFTTSSGIFLNGMVFTLCVGICVCLLWVHGSEEYSDKYNYSLVPLSWFLLGHHCWFTHHCFCTFHSNVSTVVLSGPKFWPHTPPRRDSQRPSGFHGTVWELLFSTVLSLKNAGDVWTALCSKTVGKVNSRTAKQ